MAAFDWVKARSVCSLKSVFQVLAEVIDGDVNSVNELGRAEFSLNTGALGKIIVIRKRDFGGIIEACSVVFELHPNEIQAHLRGPQVNQHLVSARPELNIQGDCLLKIEGETEPLQLWQFSRKALEDFFFAF